MDVLRNWRFCACSLAVILTSVHGQSREEVEIEEQVIRMPLNAEHTEEASRRTPGCHLGDDFHSLEELWNPKLEPIGKLVCVICQCLPVIKKGRMQSDGRITCRNMKHDCPVAECAEPVLPPGQCCKQCPGQHLPSLHSYMEHWWFPANIRRLNSGVLSDTDTVTTRDFIVMMTEPSPSRSDRELAPAQMAGGRFTLHHTSLYYSIFITNMRRSAQLQFLDDSGSLLYERNFNNIHENNLLCGSWHSLPRVYIDILLEGNLKAVLTPGERPSKHVNGTLMNHITPVYGLESSGRSSRNRSRSHDMKRSTVKVTFRSGRRRLRRVTIGLVETEQGFEARGRWVRMKGRYLKKMAAGAIEMEIRVRNSARLQGPILARSSCDSLQAVLSSTTGSLIGMDVVASENIYNSTSQYGGSVVNLHIKENGRLRCEAFTSSSPDDGPFNLSLETGPNHRGRSAELCRITPSISSSNDDDASLIKGTCKNLDAWDLQQLWTRRVFVSLRGAGSRLQYGVVTPLFYTQHLSKDTGVSLELLPSTSQSDDVVFPMTSFGHARVNLGEDCSLHYQLLLGEVSLDEEENAITAVISSSSGEEWMLEEFLATSIQGTVRTLPDEIYSAFNTGQATLSVRPKLHPSQALTASVYLPNTCHRESTTPRQTVPPFIDNDPTEDNSIMERYSCEYGGDVYPEGESWATHDACQTCSCKKGDAVCHRAMCPTPECNDPIMLEGDCCPQCLSLTNSSEGTCFSRGDKRHHRFGTRWHPYVAPFGYMKCALCQCSEANDGIDCSRKPCPPLGCAEENAVQSSDECCPVCPEVEPQSPEPRYTAMLGDIDDSDACMFRGIKYLDGAEWHPSVQPFGAVKCVTCSCKNTKTKCQRQKCPNLRCESRYQSWPEDRCCPICIEPPTLNDRDMRRI